MRQNILLIIRTYILNIAFRNQLSFTLPLIILNVAADSMALGTAEMDRKMCRSQKWKDTRSSSKMTMLWIHYIKTNAA